MKTQREIVLEYLTQSDKGITQLEATNMFGFTRLPAIIFALKKEGYTFKITREKGVNRYGRKVSFDRYFVV